MTAESPTSQSIFATVGTPRRLNHNEIDLKSRQAGHLGQSLLSYDAAVNGNGLQMVPDTGLKIQPENPGPPDLGVRHETTDGSWFGSRRL